MNRRAFLTGLLSTAAVVSVAPTAASADLFGPVIAYVPPNLSPLYLELQAITRKAFVPRLFVELYKKSPLLDAVWDDTELSHQLPRSL